MNKILSQALKKAVSEYSPEVKEVERNNRPDLFSLNSETELFQNEKGIIIKIDRSRDSNLTDFGKVLCRRQFTCSKNLQLHKQFMVYAGNTSIIQWWN
jgi:ribonucleoside-diphosphate reductase alpha chain